MLAEYLERITMEEKDVKIHLHKSTGSDVLQTVTLKLFNQAGSRHVTVVYPWHLPKARTTDHHIKYTILTHNRGT